jgi:hypothetical protein
MTGQFFTHNTGTAPVAHIPVPADDSHDVTPLCGWTWADDTYANGTAPVTCLDCLAANEEYPFPVTSDVPADVDMRTVDWSQLMADLRAERAARDVKAMRAATATARTDSEWAS